jgi:hypothetical protein
LREEATLPPFLATETAARDFRLAYRFRQRPEILELFKPLTADR